MTHVPYKGAAQAVPDLLSGVIQVMIPSALEVGEHIKRGALRGIAVTGKIAVRARFPISLPVAEQGYPDFDVVTWFGVVAPAGTPPAIVAALQHRDPRHPVRRRTSRNASPRSASTRSPTSRRSSSPNSSRRKSPNGRRSCGPAERKIE